MGWGEDLKTTENEERGHENGTGRKGSSSRESIVGFIAHRHRMKSGRNVKKHRFMSPVSHELEETYEVQRTWLRVNYNNIIFLWQVLERKQLLQRDTGITDKKKVNQLAQ